MKKNRSSAFAIVALLVVPAVSAFAAGNDPCKVLTAEKFGQIMGYTATVIKPASTQMTCFYQGPAKSGGQFMILSETAAPHAADRFKGRGSTPPAGSGQIGGAYQQGSVFFSLSIKSTDQSKLEALVAEIKRNLK